MTTHELTQLRPRIRASHHSLSGCRHGEKPKHTLVQRAAAAHFAGITEIGACPDDLGTWAPAELLHAVNGHHVRVRELEWIDLGEPDEHAEEILFRMADIFGARQVNVGVCSPGMYPEPYLVRRLTLVAQRAAERGMKVAFEPVVFGSVGDVGTVQRLIEQARQPNVGTLLDVYHLARSPRWDRLDGIWPELVAGVQINGIGRASSPPPSWPVGLLHEAQCGRLLPDEGDFDVATWLYALMDKGVEAPLSVEILSDAQRACSVYDAAERITASSVKFFDQWAGA